MTSSRVFLDYDVQPTKEYIGWLGRNPDIAKQVNADVVTKTETLTIGEIFSYMKQEAMKDAFFVCTATIDDVVHDSPWYLAKISVYYKSDEAIFVLLGGAGRELTGKHASELVGNYFEANGNKENGFEVPVPQALLNTIGQTYKFNVKIQLRIKLVALDRNGTLATGDDIIEPSKSPQDSAEVGRKRMGDGVEIGNAKRSKDGN
ncbi:hypothetical protein F2Q69_00042739 [Brassica cretica]|uniref:Uncharacterized protein n=1 Tax=Brassica cretica TaxID=69181 RepID=A0A8S9NS93_BRACR|nr:hypothetical protein F2Q69_00042739 [Brassica cretica]